jgi:hypothetical protein
LVGFFGFCGGFRCGDAFQFVGDFDVFGEDFAVLEDFEEGFVADLAGLVELGED